MFQIHRAIIFLLTHIVLVYSHLNAQVPDWRWAKSLGGIVADAGNSLTVDPLSGDIYSTGSFEGTVDFDPGPGTFNLTSSNGAGIYVLKTNFEGNFVWAKAMYGTASCSALSILFDPSGGGSIYSSGGFAGTVDFDPGPGTFNLTSNGYSSAFISKLDASGSFIWAKAMGGSSMSGAYAYSITVDPGETGGIYTTGYFYRTIDFDPGPGTFNLTSNGNMVSIFDLFILKLDASGNFVWAKAIGGPSDELGFEIVADTIGLGAVYLTGYFNGTVDFDPGIGTFNMTAPLTGAFVAKYTHSGNFVWAKGIGGNDGGAYGYSMTRDIAGTMSIYFAGVFFGTVDFDPGPGTITLTSIEGGFDSFIVKLDSSGNFVWAKSMSGPESEECTSLALDQLGSGEVYLTGLFEETVDFDPGPNLYNLTSAGNYDIYISKLDSLGNFIWAQRIGGTDNEFSKWLLMDNVNRLHITGQFYSPSIEIGSETLTNAGYSDIFLAQLCSNVVTSTNNDGRGSLRDIVACSSPGTNITFALPPLSQIVLTTGEILIDKNITLSAPYGTDLTISGNSASRIFNLSPGYSLELINLSLKNATSTINGGAIFSRGNLILNNVLFDNNFENGIPKGFTVGTGAITTVLGNSQISN